MGETKELPILFSGPMVRAILEGRKTQTRRVLQNRHLSGTGWGAPGAGADPVAINANLAKFCPYGQPWSRLWVRETWRTAKSLDDLSPHGMANKAIEAGWSRPWAPIKYEADGSEVNTNTMFGAEWGKTRVSIHMPRWAARLTLEVTEVRVQRLQEISEEDALAEGFVRGAFSRRVAMSKGAFHLGPVWSSAREAFRELWDSINGERPGCSWEANPWVWAISFRRFL